LTPPKVLILIDSLRLGGAESLAVTTACDVDSGCFSPHLLVTRDAGPLEGRLVEAGVPYTILGRRHRFWIPAYRRAHRLAREADLIHAHKFGSAVWGALLARATDTPLIVHDHNWSGEASPLRTLCQRTWIAPVARRVLCASPAVATRTIAEGFEGAQVDVVLNGIRLEDPLSRTQARRELGLPPDAFVIGIVGRLRTEKGHEILLRAVAQLVRADRDVTVSVIGGGERLEELQELAGQLAIGDRIVWAGDLPNAARVFPAFDVAAIPSRWEGLPLAALEALVAGVPLVAADVEGLVEALPVESASLFPPGDHDALARALADVMDHPEAANKRAQRALPLAREQYGSERMIREVEAVYSQVLDSGAPLARGMRLTRERQGVGPFVAGDPARGYYSDLTEVARSCQWARAPAPALAQRAAAHPVSVVQLGLGAWQLSGSDGSWRQVADSAADAVLDAMDPQGRLPYQGRMPHTYRLSPPWFSAMAQGQAASLLVRVAATLDRPDLVVRALDATRSLVEPPLVAQTDEGPVLQEYPTTPPAHVLNGWIFALWGLYDVVSSFAAAPPVEPGHQAALRAARSAFQEGAAALARRLPLYSVGHGWSRYDLYPHPLTNVASPFYHRLHLAQLEVMAVLVPGEPAFPRTAERWARPLHNPFSFTAALARKVAFRVVVPRRAAA
jgi:glycosyltransferase involved in cell wall biosynthesis